MQKQGWLWPTTFRTLPTFGGPWARNPSVQTAAGAAATLPSANALLPRPWAGPVSPIDAYHCEGLAHRQFEVNLSAPLSQRRASPSGKTLISVGCLLPAMETRTPWTGTGGALAWELKKKSVVAPRSGRENAVTSTQGGAMAVRVGSNNEPTSLANTSRCSVAVSASIGPLENTTRPRPTCLSISAG